MESLATALSASAFFGFIALLVWNHSQKKQAEQRMLFEAQKQILDKLGSGQELTQFLAGEVGTILLTARTVGCACGTDPPIPCNNGGDSPERR